ncbi:helix-turn-helix domain-containing protein [Nitrosomonas marina]|uniref:DNA-binding transcriptional regulator YiaG, contains XRE-type HTH domain n=1 Tax=Nitrosomonas marina TaxID=917 RepID=A0A1H8ITD8_9PROT|nr:helix-turn-helix domain-containing protein [Nitrosomonas marina]SEN71639.1 DNA-binding transcriptional regulator YiaG, contains XRE-type HTH domain [Nitrosomonas marina]
MSHNAFHYTSCGLSNIWLKNGYKTITTKYGKATSIHDIEGLHRAIGRRLINNKPKLNGSEIRFLRKELDLSQVNLAGLLGVDESTVRSWEKDRAGVPPPAERVIRLLYKEKINGDKEINSMLENISQLDREIHEYMILLEETESGWSEAA